MKAIILAAGIASRLRPLTNDRPKCLLKIGDRSLLERTIDAILVKYPISLKSQLQNAFKAKDLIIKFMNEEDINTHMRITLGTQKQNRLVIDTIKEVVSTPS